MQSLSDEGAELTSQDLHQSLFYKLLLGVSRTLGMMALISPLQIRSIRGSIYLLVMSTSGIWPDCLRR